MAGSIQSQKLIVIAELEALRQETARDIYALRASATGLKHSVLGWPLRQVTRKLLLSVLGGLTGWLMVRKMPKPVAMLGMLGMRTVRSVFSKLIRH
jgi:hypothetical protein